MFGFTREEANEIADAKVSLHDRHRVEVKLDIDLGDDDASGYRVETYFFVPSALNITPYTYSKTLFYSSIQRYIRFKTPQFPLTRIIDPTEEASPLARIRKDLQALAAPEDRERVEAIFRETKMLGAVSRGAIRDSVKQVLGDLAGAHRADAGAPDLHSALDGGLALVAEIDAYLAAIRSLRADMLADRVPVKLREAFLFFDEFISLTVQDYLSTLLEAIRERTDLKAASCSLDQALTSIIIGQQAHRQSMGYPSVISNGKTDATLLYRRSVLKKFISNVLFLTPEVSEWEGISQVPLAVAAACAMLFAATVTVFAQSTFATNSMPFIFIVVVSYAFKDRLKDWLKLFLSKGLVRWTADRKIRIRDPNSGRVIGRMKEAFSFTTETQIPAEVRYCRSMDNITSIDEEGKPERIIKYEKEVSLFPERISRFHQRRRNLNDIMRFNIDDFVRQADDPLVEYLHLDPASGSLRRTECQRVYHLNMVFAYRSLDGAKHPARLERVRLVLNRDGIVRLEEVVG